MAQLSMWAFTQQGGYHQTKVGQRPQKDPGTKKTNLAKQERKRQIQGRKHRQGAGVESYT